MNTDTISGKFDQAKGKIKQTVGEATNNDRLANSGAADQVKGAAKEAWGSVKDAVNSASNNAKANMRVERTEATMHGEEHAHNVRNGIVNAAQDAKDAVVRHTK